MKIFVLKSRDVWPWGAKFANSDFNIRTYRYINACTRIWHHKTKRKNKLIGEIIILLKYNKYNHGYLHWTDNFFYLFCGYLHSLLKKARLCYYPKSPSMKRWQIKTFDSGISHSTVPYCVRTPRSLSPQLTGIHITPQAPTINRLTWRPRY